MKFSVVRRFVSAIHIDEANKNWIANSSRVSLTATDPVPASGVKVIQYTFGDAAFQNYSGPFTVPMEGIDYALRYLSFDNVGNKEAERSVKIRMDKTPPVTKRQKA